MSPAWPTRFNGMGPSVSFLVPAPCTVCATVGSSAPGHAPATSDGAGPSARFPARYPPRPVSSAGGPCRGAACRRGNANALPASRGRPARSHVPSAASMVPAMMALQGPVNASANPTGYFPAPRVPNSATAAPTYPKEIASKRQVVPLLVSAGTTSAAPTASTASRGGSGSCAMNVATPVRPWDGPVIAIRASEVSIAAIAALSSTI